MYSPNVGIKLRSKFLSLTAIKKPAARAIIAPSFLFGFLFAFPLATQAAVCSVPSGSYPTIQAAVNAPGCATIKVAAGNYAEHVSVNRSVILKGHNAGIAGNGARGPESIVDGADTDAPFAVHASDVTIDGFTVQNGSNGGFQSGIWSTGTNNDLLIQNNIITENSIGVFAYCGTNCVITKNLFDGNNKPGASGGTAIYSEVSDGLTINENEFKNHTVNNPILLAANPPYLAQHTNLTVSNNILNNDFGIYALGVDVGAFTGNDIETNAATALSLDASNRNLTITGNLIHDNARGVRVRDDGTGAGPASGFLINRNSFTGNADYGVGNESGYTGSLDARCNWWGAVDGPGPVGPGTGDKVTVDVTFNPWRISADLNVPSCNFRNVRRPGDITVGPDLGGTGHESINFTGSIGSAGDTWITVYDTTPADNTVQNTFGSVTLDADVLIHRFNNRKGGGLLALYNEAAGKKGLALIINDAGNTDTLVLSSVDYTTGKLTTLKSIPLGAGGIAENKWYHLSMEVVVSGADVTVTGMVFKHTTETDPNSSLGAQVGGTLLSTSAPRPSGVDATGEVGIIASATSAVVDTSVTNFTINSVEVPEP